MVKDGQQIIKEWAMGSSERRGGNPGRGVLPLRAVRSERCGRAFKFENDGPL